jgi:hypothetical protein
VATPTGLSRQPDHSERSAELLHHFKAPNFYTTSMALIAPNRPSNVRLGPQGRSCVRSAVGVIGARPCAANRVPAGVHARGSVRAGRSSSPATAGRFMSSTTLDGPSPDASRMPRCAGAEAESDHGAANVHRSGIEEPPWPQAALHTRWRGGPGRACPVGTHRRSRSMVTLDTNRTQVGAGLGGLERDELGARAAGEGAVDRSPTGGGQG